jgi:hypothetical protein
MKMIDKKKKRVKILLIACISMASVKQKIFHKSKGEAN